MIFLEIYLMHIETTGKYRDSSKMEIALRKAEFEKSLNDFYAAYRKNPILYAVKYQEQLKAVKESGCKVLRNSAGIHKIKF
ncbi:MAG: hypothetical protein ACLTWK_00785 [Eisenbergiella sp.]